MGSLPTNPLVSSVAVDPIMPQRVYAELNRVLPRDCMVTIDAGSAPGLWNASSDRTVNVADPTDTSRWVRMPAG